MLIISNLTKITLITTVYIGMFSRHKQQAETRLCLPATGFAVQIFWNVQNLLDSHTRK